MDPGSCYWLVNPEAGDGSAVDELRAAVRDRAGDRWRETGGADDLKHTIERLCDEGVEAIGVAGGDGTLHDTINVLMHCDHRPKLAVVPCGTANDFATGLGITSIAAAIDAVEQGDTQAVDVVSVDAEDGLFLINAASGGFGAAVNERLDDDIKQWWGKLAYARASVDVAREPEVYQVTLTMDGDEHEFAAHAVLLLNGSRAGGLTLLPDASPTDGLLEVVVVCEVEGIAKASLFAAFARQRHAEHDAIARFRCAEVAIQSDPPLPIMGDGEPLPDGARRFAVQPGAVSLFAPQPSE